MIKEENNKPKYCLFKNSKYALSGLRVTFKNETSFKLEILAAIPLLFAIYFIDFSIIEKVILLITLFLTLIVELINSAIENVVDITTKEYHLLAKNAKDMGAGAVFVSIALHLSCWVIFYFS